MAENATKCSAADGVTQTFDFSHGTPLMVRAVDFNALYAEFQKLRKDAERWRHCRAHGHPITGPQCIAWTFDGRMVFGATPEEAVDRAMSN